mgnify:CR=1 FL=1
MKNIILTLLLLSSLTTLSFASSIRDSFALEYLTSNNTLVVNKLIDNNFKDVSNLIDDKKNW